MLYSLIEKKCASEMNNLAYHGLVSPTDLKRWASVANWFGAWEERWDVEFHQGQYWRLTLGGIWPPQSGLINQVAGHGNHT